jgi:hypothetical protein
MVWQNLRRSLFICIELAAENLLGRFRPRAIPDALSACTLFDFLSSSHSGVEFDFPSAHLLRISVRRFFLVRISPLEPDLRALFGERVQSAHRGSVRWNGRETPGRSFDFPRSSSPNRGALSLAIPQGARGQTRGFERRDAVAAHVVARAGFSSFVLE